MKEATGEVSMTIITLVAIAVIGAIVAANWDNISGWIGGLWGSDTNDFQCTKYDEHGNCIG